MQYYDTPLTQLEESIEEFNSEPTESNLQLTSELLKRYSSIFVAATRQETFRINCPKSNDSRNELVIKFIGQIEQLRSRYHKLLSPVQKQGSGIEKLRREYRFADEYQSRLVLASFHFFYVKRAIPQPEPLPFQVNQGHL